MQSQLDEPSLRSYITLAGVRYYYNIHFRPLGCETSGIEASYKASPYSSEDCDMIASGLQLWLAGLLVKMVSTVMLAFPTSYWYLVNFRMRRPLLKWALGLRGQTIRYWQVLLHLSAVRRCHRIYAQLFPCFFLSRR
eukprot:scaffold666_cov332-Prasinococcus_capsulatus_cf.AAC.8